MPGPRWITLALACILAAGCNVNDTAPDLLRVVDVAPRELESGDRLEVLGTNLPTGDAREATITFRGTLKRPGEAAIEGQTIVVDKAKITTDKVSAQVSEALVARFCGQGDESAHTTFRGDVTVTLETKSEGALPVTGSVKDVILDVRPKAPRRAVALARERDGQRALDFLGITVSKDAPTSSGLVVAAVRPDSPAAAAKIEGGDVITSFEGVKVTGVADVIPSGEERAPIVVVQRRAEEPRAVPISIEGFHASAPSDLLGAAIILGLSAATMLVFATPLGALVAWLVRRVASRLASARSGKKAAARSPVARLASEVHREVASAIAPPDADPILSKLAPVLAFAAISTTFVVMPFSQRLVGADLDVGMLFLLALASLLGLALVTGGSLASEPWSVLRGLRGAGRVLLQELPAVVAIVCVVLSTGSLRLEDMVAAQGGQGGSPLDAGGWPWHWFVFRNPATFVLFLVFLTSMITADGRASSALREAEASGDELAPPARVSARQLLFYFGEWAHVFVACGIASAIFLGGWQIPGVPGAAQESEGALKILGALLFLLKSWALVLSVVWLRWALPRLGAEQRSRIALRWFVPLAIVASAFVVLGTLASTTIGFGRNAGLVSGVVTFVTWAAFAAHFVRRIQVDLRETRAPLHLNPLI
ncbi:NADH-quinone oxidoreductase subunit H [Polyangium spumosum]|uniref:PDZ domain-containing protein n=1 Tax=Polyangium spumosum TaxID=889282 RepID=A0A6N7Q415_9BACT|nr:NADH-quinone oxidoreductase subunit H [Polyangium spumosum]MRG97385.1 PDZ domain-containing protein [Polyangium spumosum]